LGIEIRGELPVTAARPIKHNLLIMRLNMSFARECRRLIALQLVLMALLSAAFYARSGMAVAVSVWFGGMIATLNAMLLLWRRRRADAGPAMDAGRSLRLLYRTALERFVLVMLLFALGMGVLKLDPFALLSGFVAGLLALVLMGMKGNSAKHVV
jgi:ATP synthase protein I